MPLPSPPVMCASPLAGLSVLIVCGCAVLTGTIPPALSKRGWQGIAGLRALPPDLAEGLSSLLPQLLGPARSRWGPLAAAVDQAGWSQAASVQLVLDHKEQVGL